MDLLSSKSICGLVASTLAWAVFPALASAQYRPQAPQSAPQPPANTVSSAYANAPPISYVPPTAYPGYAPGYGPVEYKGAYGGALSGAADVINAGSNAIMSGRQSDIVR